MRIRLRKVTAVLLSVALILTTQISFLTVKSLTSADLNISENGVQFICDREGFHPTCYRDASQSSIGYGTKCTGSSTQPHAAGLHSITREQAFAEMKYQINATYAPRVRAQTSGIEMNQNQFDALVSLCYNCGGGTTKIANSPLVKYLKGQLSESEARSQYSSYIITSNGVVLQGLINRRNLEADLFFSDSTPDPIIPNNDGHNPITGSDAIEGGNGYVHVRGWAFDPDNTSHNIFVHVYIGGQAGDPNAECYAITAEHGGRSDIDGLYHCGDHHAYDANVTTSKRGVQPVYLYAINVNEGENVMFASETVNIGEGASGNADPVAHIDYVSASEGKVHVAGWIYDPDDLEQSLMIHVYVGGIAGSANAESHAICANAYRPDVNNAYHCGDYHGFETYVPTTKTGEQEVHIYAINIGGGINPCFFDGGVNIPKETEPPIILESYISNRTNDGFRINIVAADNVGVEKISIATWTQDGQSDLIWTDAVNCGGGYFILDRKYSDFQTNPDGIYNNHAYVYDYSGNVTVTCPCLENDPPTIDDYYITNITQTSYRICAVPHDNSGIHDVLIAAWTASSNESDIKWLTVHNDGNGTYYADVNRDEFQQYSNSEYINQINVFDNSGNETPVRFKMDYKLTSDTGKCVPEGDYRIVTALSDDCALDVTGDSSNNGANIQINSNLANNNQIFSLVYDENGLYRIINKNSGKALDVENDTYVNGTNVMQYSSNPGASNQQWILQDEGDGFYKIISRTNGLALDVAGAVNDDGTNVWVYTNYPSIQQKWKLRRVLKTDMISVGDVTLTDINQQVAPDITVTVDGLELTKDTDYSVSITADAASGTGKAVITGLNGYCDSVEKSFSVTVEDPTVPGDVFSDGVVNMKDLVLLQQYLNHWNVEIDEAAADVNDDGKINMKDLVLIQQYLNNWDVVLI